MGILETLARSPAEDPGNLKVLIWGAQSSAKTLTALEFSKHFKTAVIDFESGTRYEDGHDYAVFPVSKEKEAMAVVSALIADEHDYDCVIVDSITLYWETLKQKHTDRHFKTRIGKPGHNGDSYTLQVQDWQPVKQEFGTFMRRLIELSRRCHLVLVGRSKKHFDLEGPDINEVACEPSVSYLVDLEIESQSIDHGLIGITVHQDRSRQLKKKFKSEGPEDTFRVINSHYKVVDLKEEEKANG